MIFKLVEIANASLLSHLISSIYFLSLRFPSLPNLMCCPSSLSKLNCLRLLALNPSGLSSLEVLESRKSSKKKQKGRKRYFCLPHSYTSQSHFLDYMIMMFNIIKGPTNLPINSILTSKSSNIYYEEAFLVSN